MFTFFLLFLCAHFLLAPQEAGKTASVHADGTSQLYTVQQRALMSDDNPHPTPPLALAPRPLTCFTALCLLTVSPVITCFGIPCNFTLAYTHAIINSAT